MAFDFEPDTFGVFHQIGVLEAQSRPSVSFEMLIAHYILFESVMVRSAVEFDDEFGGGTGEISEEAVDGRKDKK